MRYTDTVASAIVGTRTYAGVHRVPVPAGQEEAWAALLARDPRVVYAEPDYLVQSKNLPAGAQGYGPSAWRSTGRLRRPPLAGFAVSPIYMGRGATPAATGVVASGFHAQAGPSPVPIALNQTVSGALTTDDARSPQRGSAYYADRYSFSATAGQQVTIAAWSTAFDVYLFLFRPDGTLLSSDDDGGGGTNARIPAGSGLLTLPETGTYVIEVTSYWTDETGSYTLELGAGGGSTPNDPSYAASQWNLRAMRLPDAWEITTGSSAVTIAVVDTGVDLAHPDLVSKIASGGWDFANSDASPQDDNGHGTHVAGIAAAATDNGVGIAGVAWQARILPVKVLNSSGSGFISDVADGIRWAADHGAQIINLSLGSTSDPQSLRDAVAYARGRGALVVAAGGNCGSPSSDCTLVNEPDYPAAYTTVVAVAATDQGDQRASFSTVQSYIDVAAPGAGILSTYWSSGSTYASLSGTSMAAPHVAGLAALILALIPQLTADEVTLAMQDTADKVGSSAYVGGRNDEYGYGRVNALAALQYTQRTGVGGLATRSDTGATLAGATVSIAGRTAATTSTDASGRFTATLAPGSYEVCLSAPSFAETCRSAAVSLGARTDLGTLALAALSSTPPGTSLAFAAQPLRAAHGYGVGVQPSIGLRDTNGVTLTADSTTVVTLAIKSGSGASGATLICDQTGNGVTTLRVTAGVATFSGCAIDRPGVAYVLEARAAGAEATKTLPFNVTWAGDANGDGRVSIADYSLDVTCFGATPADSRWLDPVLRCWRADLDGDHAVDVVDHSIVVTRFGTSTPTPVAPSGPAP
ncbi:MAG: S8 family serine peptidase [Chloroflexi bacterium]|nr:S8 family serine peptidase [Chloroflexota bacterium]